jgi:hypothetical protein
MKLINTTYTAVELYGFQTVGIVHGIFEVMLFPGQRPSDVVANSIKFTPHPIQSK